MSDLVIPSGYRILYLPICVMFVGLTVAALVDDAKMTHFFLGFGAGSSIGYFVVNRTLRSERLRRDR
jgi:hypothetical protein